MGKIPSQGSEPFDWKACRNTKKYYYQVVALGVCSIFWKKQVMLVCVQNAFNMNEKYEQAAFYLKTWSFSLTHRRHAENIKGRLNFIKGRIAFFPHIVVFYKNTASCLSEYLVFKAIIL